MFWDVRTMCTQCASDVLIHSDVFWCWCFLIKFCCILMYPDVLRLTLETNVFRTFWNVKKTFEITVVLMFSYVANLRTSGYNRIRFENINVRKHQKEATTENIKTTPIWHVFCTFKNIRKTSVSNVHLETSGYNKIRLENISIRKRQKESTSEDIRRTLNSHVFLHLKTFL